MQDNLMLTTYGPGSYVLLDEFGGQRGDVFATVAAAVEWARANGFDVEPDYEITGAYNAYCSNR